MGGDGGTIAANRKYMRGYKDHSVRLEGRDERACAREKIGSCAITGAPLQEPIVACELGNFYNKEALLQGLLTKSLGEPFAHVSRLKDVKTLMLKRAADKVSIECPVTGVELNGSQPFFVVWSTGCVLSERAVKEVGLEQLQDEYGPFSALDLVAVAPLDAALPEARVRMEERRALARGGQKKGSGEGGSARGVKRRVFVGGEDGSGAAVRKQQRGSEQRASLSSASAIAQQAAERLQAKSGGSSVFSSLFSDGSAPAPSGRDLFLGGGNGSYIA